MANIEWLLCPVCRNKTRIKLRLDTVLENFPLYCPKCKQETLITVSQDKHPKAAEKPDGRRKQMTGQSKNNRLLPLTVIEAAAGGDVEAINAVLKHYAGYIARLSMRELYDEYGNPHLCVDEELRRRLETKLITKLLTFRVR